MKRHFKQNLLVTTFIILVFAIMVISTIIWMTENNQKQAEITTTQIVSDTTTTEVTTTEVETTVVETTTEPEPAYTEDELYCMAAAIYNEAGSNSCSDDTRRLVGYVILNRVNHPSFPNTIRGVLEQKSQYGNFYWTGVKFASRSQNACEQQAVERAYRIAKEVLETEKIPIPSTVVFQASFKQGPTYCYQDDLYFCYLGR